MLRVNFQQLQISRVLSSVIPQNKFLVSRIYDFEKTSGNHFQKLKNLESI